MARAFIKGMSAINKYFKKGYNIVARHVRDEEPNDDVDLFEYLGHSSSLKIAKARLKKIKLSYGILEIVKHKESKEDI